MRYLSIIILTLTLSNCMGQPGRATQSESLFLISNSGKYGFIDSKGQVVIEPKFRALSEFSEGLAAARISGSYGYINHTGTFVIQPYFDYATPFSDGLALVYKDDKSFYINTTGEKAFDCNYPEVGQFKNGSAVIATETKKYGVINKQGKLIIDTIFSQLNPVGDGMMIVEGANHLPYGDQENGLGENYESGVIDTLGNFLIPFGRFEKIYNYEDGYFQALIPKEPWDSIDGYTLKTAIIDQHGTVIVAKDHQNHFHFNGNLHCGLVSVHLYQYWLPEEDGITYTSEKSYQGYMNLKGEILISDTIFKRGEDFSDNRAFVQDDNGQYSIINTSGEFVARNAYNRIMGTGFKNGLALVAVDWKWGLIDTNANFIITPQFSDIDEVGIMEDYFFFKEYDADRESGYDYLVGVAGTDGNILIKPIMQEVDGLGFRNGLLKCIIDTKLSYLNKNGKIVWQEKLDEAKELSTLNIDYMKRGYFYAYSLPNEKEYSGGWAKSQNIPQKILKTSGFTKNAISVMVTPVENDTFSKRYKAHTVYIANNTSTNILFNAQDSRLYMKVQALHPDGQWKDIEYLPSSWCGNSYHNLTLTSKYYWRFPTPEYEGDFKTKLRIELKYIDPADKSKKSRDRMEVTVYSNEYEGSINPGQFWRKQDYFPGGLMDPYND